MKAKTITTTTKAPESATAACRALFGRCPEDVLQPLKSASDALGWVREMLLTIEREAREMRAPESSRIVALAEAAGYLACDFANLVDCEREEMAEYMEGGKQ